MPKRGGDIGAEDDQCTCRREHMHIDSFSHQESCSRVNHRDEQTGIRARAVTSIRSILKTGLDRAFLEGSEDASPLQHANIRGGGYYH